MANHIGLPCCDYIIICNLFMEEMNMTVKVTKYKDEIKNVVFTCDGCKEKMNYAKILLSLSYAEGINVKDINGVKEGGVLDFCSKECCKGWIDEFIKG